MARLKVDQLDAVILVAALVVTACGAKTIRLVNDAMAPTLKAGHDYVVNTGAYDSASPKRADIILFNINGQRIARIIGLPAETITIAAGSVSVDGTALSEPYLAPGTSTTAPQDSYAVPSGSYFVMYDNRSHLGDSRTLGFVPRSAIEGRL
jgi:signal peptidase I